MKSRSGKSSKVKRAWLAEHVNDPYVRRAQHDGYRARAAYKLQEIDQAFDLVRPGQAIADLGSAPGAWSQYLQRKLGLQHAATGGAPASVVFALDLLPMEPVAGVHFLQGDFRELEVAQELEAMVGARKLDLVLSDMAPNLSGIAVSDAARVSDLVELALEFAVQHLVPDGVLVAKVFHGSGYGQLVRAFKDRFRAVRAFKPQASRSRSAETYLVARALRQPAMDG